MSRGGRKKRPLIRVSWLEAFAMLAEYRREMPVGEVMICSSAHGKTEYYICPRCHSSMDREFVAFCDRCGQRLGWKEYKRARRIYPGQRGAMQRKREDHVT